MQHNEVKSFNLPFLIFQPLALFVAEIFVAELGLVTEGEPEQKLSALSRNDGGRLLLNLLVYNETREAKLIAMKAIAKHDFNASAEDELSFRKHQILRR